MEARPDARPELRLPALVLRRYAGRLLLASRPPTRAAGAVQRDRIALGLAARPLAAADGGRCWHCAPIAHGDLDLARLPATAVLVQHVAAPLQAVAALRKLHAGARACRRGSASGCHCCCAAGQQTAAGSCLQSPICGSPQALRSTARARAARANLLAGTALIC